jgi:hypothetical protein
MESPSAQQVSRRNVLQAAAGLASGLASVAAGRLAADEPSRPSGIIDCQGHLYCPEHLALMESWNGSWQR